MKQVELNYRTPGSDATRQRGRVGIASLIAFLTAVALIAPYFLVPSSSKRESTLGVYFLFGWAVAILLAFSGIVLAGIGIATNRTSRKAWLGLLLNLTLLSFVGWLVLTALTEPRGPGP